MWFKKERNVQLPQNIVNPAFGEVNVHYKGGKKTVVATVLMEPYVEGTQTGVAIDGSASMVNNKSFGHTDEPGPGTKMISLRCGGKTVKYGYNEDDNSVEQICQRVVPYLAEKLDADGGTTVVYWACGDGGRNVQLVGDLTADQARSAQFPGPDDWGTGTCLLPAMKYFVDRFADAEWGFYVFITDGALSDLDDVVRYTLELAKGIHAGKRKPVKCVLIGVGSDVNEDQMSILDDLDDTHNAPYDIWDHKIAADMRDLKDIFAEVVDENAKVAPFGKILDDRGNVVVQWSDGVPTILKFELPEKAEYFVLELPTGKINQTLKEE